MKKDIDTKILIALLKETPNYVSGNILAQELGLSRVSIWGHLTKLKKEGFVFEAIQNRGYCLVAEPNYVQKNLLEAYAYLVNTSADFIYFDSIDSTNSEVERQIASDRKTPFAIIARKMTQGRARLGRTWISDLPGNLYITFGFRPHLPPESMQKFSLWMGISFCQFVKDKTGLDINIKWPNDLVIKGKKVAGMLAEARVDADYTRDMIFGVGLNINGTLESWPEELQGKATTLEIEKESSFNINQFAVEFIQHGVDAYAQFIDQKSLPNWEDLWEQFDYLKEKQITVTTHGQTFSGSAKGIDDNGSLLLDMGEGIIKRLNAGDVTLSNNY